MGKTKYLGIISRNELNILFKKGYVILCSNLRTKVSLEDIKETEVAELLRRIPPFDYTSEYVFIEFDKIKRGEVEYKNVLSIIPFDTVAKRDFKMSFNEMIEFSAPLWESVVEDHCQYIFEENMRRGAKACLEIFGIKDKSDALEAKLGDEDLITKFANFQFKKETLDDDSTIWQYLLMYERHEPYPDTILGYFYDAVHVYVNKRSGKELLSMPSSKVLSALNIIEKKNYNRFPLIVNELEKNSLAENYIKQNVTDNIRLYVLIPIYFYLLNTLSSDSASLMIEKGLRDSIKDYKEYKLAVYLAGLRLGFDSINELYYNYGMNARKKQNIKNNPNQQEFMFSE